MAGTFADPRRRGGVVRWRDRPGAIGTVLEDAEQHAVCAAQFDGVIDRPGGQSKED